MARIRAGPGPAPGGGQGHGRKARVSSTVVPTTPASMAASRVRVGGGVDVVGPHDQGVLVGLGVVVLAHAGGFETEPAVHGLGAGRLETRTSRVRWRAPGASEARARLSSSRVPIWWRCQAGSTAMVVTWASSPLNIRPP